MICETSVNPLHSLGEHTISPWKPFFSFVICHFISSKVEEEDSQKSFNIYIKQIIELLNRQLFI